MKIATHNSISGEAGYGILSWLVTPFSRCQSKTIEEQYMAGNRYFDIRVKETRRGWICAHGLWQSKKLLHEILDEIAMLGNCYVMLTYEGEAPTDFLEIVDSWVNQFNKITFTSINTKKPTWKCLRIYNNVPMQGAFKNLDGSTWHTYLPIPWLWKKLYYNNPKFNDIYYTMVDFL